MAASALSPSNGRARTAAIVGGALLGLLGILALVATCAPSAAPARWIAAVAPFAEPHAVAAESALARREFDRADRETWAELRVSPVRASAWLRLARIDLLRNGALSPRGFDALGHAYDAEPYDLDSRSPRMSWALQHYEALSPPLRASVADELRAWVLSPVLKARLKILATDASPAGRAAVAAAVEGVP